MSAPSAQQQREFSRIEGLVSRARNNRWIIEDDDTGKHIVAIRGNDALATSGLICTIHPEASADEEELLILALSHARMMVDMRQRFVEAYRDLKATIEQDRGLKSGDFAANAAIILAQPSFWRFLEERHLDHAVHSKDQADSEMKKLIGISSKKQLNSDARAQERFIQLRAQYEAFVREGR